MVSRVFLLVIEAPEQFRCVSRTVLKYGNTAKSEQDCDGKNDNEPGDFWASHAKCGLTRTAWMYMKGMVKETTTMLTVDLPKKHVNLHPRMRLESWRRTITMGTLAFKTQPQIKNLRSVLGQFISVEMQVGVMKLNHSQAHLVKNDVCYLLLCTSQFILITS
jgi:hypothetical protein